MFEYIKYIKRLGRLDRKDNHRSSPKKLGNCGVKYTKDYYIIYIYLCINSNRYMSQCGIVWLGEFMRRRGVVITCFLAIIWTLKLFNRGCDIWKEFRFEIPAKQKSQVLN